MKRNTEKVFSFMRSQVDFCVGIAFVIMGVVYYVLSYTQTRGVSDWSLSPGFFPRLASGFIIGLGILLSVLSLFSSKKANASAPEKIKKRVMLYVILTIVMMLLYVYLMQWLGFILATIVTSAGMMIFLGSRRWAWIIAVSIAFPLFIYFFALKIMFVLFPAGKIFE